MAEKHYRSGEACRFVKDEYGIDRAPSTFAKQRCLGGDAPEFRRLGRAIYYSESDLRSWAERWLGKAFRNTSEADQQKAA